MATPFKTAQELGITERQRINIARLTAYVHRIYSRRTAGERCAFRMSVYGIASRCGEDLTKARSAKQWSAASSAARRLTPFMISIRTALATRCDTAACFAGHGPMAGIEPEQYDTWSQYVRREFVSCERYVVTAGQPWPEGRCVGEHVAWAYLFASQWPDDPIHAARRGACFLQHGIPRPVPGYFSTEDDAVARWLARGFPHGFRARWKEIEKLADTPAE